MRSTESQKRSYDSIDKDSRIQWLILVVKPSCLLFCPTKLRLGVFAVKTGRRLFIRANFGTTRQVPDYFLPGMVMLETVIVSPFISPVSCTA
jgi:hypothetical protein